MAACVDDDKLGTTKAFQAKLKLCGDFTKWSCWAVAPTVAGAQGQSFPAVPSNCFIIKLRQMWVALRRTRERKTQTTLVSWHPHTSTGLLRGIHWWPQASIWCSLKLSARQVSGTLGLSGSDLLMLKTRSPTSICVKTSFSSTTWRHVQSSWGHCKVHTDWLQDILYHNQEPMSFSSTAAASILPMTLRMFIRSVTADSSRCRASHRSRMWSVGLALVAK